MSRAWCLCLCASVVLSAAAGCKAAASENKAAPPVVDSAAPVASSEPKADVEQQQAFYEVPSVANPARMTRLSFKGGGILRKLKVREGERVKTGQLIAVLDATDVSIRAQSAQVAHAQALEAVKNAQDDLNRAQMLFDAGALPDQTIQKAELAMRVATLQVEAARVGMRMAGQALADTSLVAPFAGVVTKVLSEEGQLVTAMPPTMICVLADVDTLELRLPIPERRLAQVKVDTPVVVLLPAINGERQAKVERIAEVVDPATRSAEAIVRLPNKDHALPAGLYARVRFPGVPLDIEDRAPASGADGGATAKVEGGR